MKMEIDLSGAKTREDMEPTEGVEDAEDSRGETLSPSVCKAAPVDQQEGKGMDEADDRVGRIVGTEDVKMEARQSDATAEEKPFASFEALVDEQVTGSKEPITYTHECLLSLKPKKGEETLLAGFEPAYWRELGLVDGGVPIPAAGAPGHSHLRRDRDNDSNHSKSPQEHVPEWRKERDTWRSGSAGQASGLLAVNRRQDDGSGGPFPGQYPRGSSWDKQKMGHSVAQGQVAQGAPRWEQRNGQQLERNPTGPHLNLERRSGDGSGQEGSAKKLPNPGANGIVSLRPGWSQAENHVKVQPGFQARANGADREREAWAAMGKGNDENCAREGNNGRAEAKFAGQGRDSSRGGGQDNMARESHSWGILNSQPGKAYEIPGEEAVDKERAAQERTRKATFEEELEKVREQRRLEKAAAKKSSKLHDEDSLWDTGFTDGNAPQELPGLVLEAATPQVDASSAAVPGPAPSGAILDPLLGFTAARSRPAVPPGFAPKHQGPGEEPSPAGKVVPLVAGGLTEALRASIASAGSRGAGKEPEGVCWDHPAGGIPSLHHDGAETVAGLHANIGQEAQAQAASTLGRLFPARSGSTEDFLAIATGGSRTGEDVDPLSLLQGASVLSRPPSGDGKEPVLETLFKKAGRHLAAPPAIAPAQGGDNDIASVGASKFAKWFNPPPEDVGPLGERRAEGGGAGPPGDVFSFLSGQPAQTTAQAAPGEQLPKAAASSPKVLPMPVGPSLEDIEKGMAAAAVTGPGASALAAMTGAKSGEESRGQPWDSPPATALEVVRLLPENDVKQERAPFQGAGSLLGTPGFWPAAKDGGQPPPETGPPKATNRPHPRFLTLEEIETPMLSDSGGGHGAPPRSPLLTSAGPLLPSPVSLATRHLLSLLKGGPSAGLINRPFGGAAAAGQLAPPGMLAPPGSSPRDSESLLGEPPFSPTTSHPGPNRLSRRSNPHPEALAAPPSGPRPYPGGPAMADLSPEDSGAAADRCGSHAGLPDLHFSQGLAEQLRLGVKAPPRHVRAGGRAEAGSGASSLLNGPATSRAPQQLADPVARGPGRHSRLQGGAGAFQQNRSMAAADVQGLGGLLLSGSPLFASGIEMTGAAALEQTQKPPAPGASSGSGTSGGLVNVAGGNAARSQLTRSSSLESSVVDGAGPAGVKLFGAALAGVKTESSKQQQQHQQKGLQDQSTGPDDASPATEASQEGTNPSVAAQPDLDQQVATADLKPPGGGAERALESRTFSMPPAVQGGGESVEPGLDSPLSLLLDGAFEPSHAPAWAARAAAPPAASSALLPGLPFRHGTMQQPSIEQVPHEFRSNWQQQEQKRHGPVPMMPSQGFLSQPALADSRAAHLPGGRNVHGRVEVQVPYSSPPQHFGPVTSSFESRPLEEHYIPISSSAGNAIHQLGLRHFGHDPSARLNGPFHHAPGPLAPQHGHPGLQNSHQQQQQQLQLLQPLFQQQQQVAALQAQHPHRPSAAAQGIPLGRTAPIPFMGQFEDSGYARGSSKPEPAGGLSAMAGFDRWLAPPQPPPSLDEILGRRIRFN